MQGLIFGRVAKRNYEWKEGEEWLKPVADAELTFEGETTEYQARSDAKGNFRVEKALPGKYLVKLRLPPGLIVIHELTHVWQGVNRLIRSTIRSALEVMPTI